MSTRLITPGELLAAPTGISWNTVAQDAGFTSPMQALEQGYLIDAISSWAGEYCGQPLGLHATTQTEQARVERAGMFPAKVIVDQDANLHFWARTLPVLSVLSAQWSYLTPPLAWNPATLGGTLPNQSGCNWTLWGDYPQQREIELFDQDYSSLRHQPAIMQVSYTSGWPCAIMTGTGTIAAGSNVSLPVDDTTGMAAIAGLTGNQLYIADGANSEWVTVASVTDATHVVASQTVNAHTPGPTNVIGVSAVPNDIRMAVIWACAGVVRARGANSVAMRTAGAAVVEQAKTGGQDELISLAEYLLQPYRVEF